MPTEPRCHAITAGEGAVAAAPARRRLLCTGDTAEVPPIREAEHAFVEFEGDIHVHFVFTLIGALQQFFSVRKPQELSIQLEVQGEQSTIERHGNIFSFAIDCADMLAPNVAGDNRGGLWLRGNGVKHVNAANLSSTDQWMQSLSYGFYFGEFGHLV